MDIPLNFLFSPKLSYFVTVSCNRNLRIAAGLLGISQPALTKSLKSLENELGVLIPLDKWFGSFHDGSPEAHKQMLERRARRGV